MLCEISKTLPESGASSTLCESPSWNQRRSSLGLFFTLLDMIVWIREYNGSLHYRYLGDIGAIICALESIDGCVTPGYVLPHSEDINNDDTTTPTIGYGASKLCRDASMKGYAVGVITDDDSRCCILRCIVNAYRDYAHIISSRDANTMH